MKVSVKPGRNSEPTSAQSASEGWTVPGELLSEDLVQAISQRPMRRFIPLFAPDPNDTQYLDTSEQSWALRLSGNNFVFDFERYAEKAAKTAGDERFLADRTVAITHLLRWAAGRFLGSYSPAYAFRLLEYCSVMFTGLSVFDSKNCIERLKKLKERDAYFPWKRLIALCCENELPGFSSDDLFDLEALQPLTPREEWQAYYDLELKLKPAVIRFIEMGVGRDLAILHDRTTSELRGLATLVLCLEGGMRPAQLFKLKEEDFKNLHNRYFSISIPPAKQAKRVDKAPFELDLSPEAGTIIQALIDRCRPDLANGQLLRFPDGSLAMAKSFDKALNSRLRAWAARNFVGPMPETAELKDFLRHLPHLTAYDFRHHVGHSLAMSGASADQIARVLGHSSTVAARHYIAATPELAVIKQKALGENAAYQEMMGMILTGEIGEESNWRGRKVAGMVDNRLFTGIGGCSSSSCDFEPVRSCYGCSDFNPFLDGDHAGVRDALKAEAASQLAISDAAGQTHRNPAVLQLEGVIAEVQMVINHCKHRKGCQ